MELQINWRIFVIMKVCNKCNEEKELSKFPFEKSKNAYRGNCKTCENKRRYERRKKNPNYLKKESLRNQIYRKSNPEKMEQRKQIYRGEYKRIKYIEKKYGLSPEEYFQMKTTYGGLCAICKIEEGTCVDHCHTTNKVRGLLCSQCNIGLGGFKDNIDFMEEGIRYLRLHSIGTLTND